MIKRFLVLPDIQYPFHDKPSIKAIEEFMPEFKPHYLIYLGDQLDLKMIRDYWHNEIGGLDAESITNDYKGFDEMMRGHIKLCGKPHTVFMEGNHEERVKRLMKQPIGQILKGSDVEIEKWFDFKKRGIEFIPFGSFYRLGKLYFKHNTYINDNCTKKAVIAFQRNIIFGDTHTRQVYTHVGATDVHDVHVAETIGCLCTRNPEWKQGDANRWVHGFTWGYYDDKTGYFNHYWTKIVRGKFMFNNKMYGAK